MLYTSINRELLEETDLRLEKLWCFDSGLYKKVCDKLEFIVEPNFFYNFLSFINGI